MKTQNTSTGITFLELTKIVQSDFNPRKNFEDIDLQELAESIKTQGVLQPIMVRPKGKKFEIVYGERRYRAALLADVGQIPTIVRDLTDTEAREIAITENLQRKDIEPIEEANAYQYLLDKLNYDIPQLVHTFGKSESFIRSRLRLNNLIPVFMDRLTSNEISIGTALELSKYNETIQEEIYDNHYKNVGYYNSWGNLKTKEVAKRISQSYSVDLTKCLFDQSECLNCQHNTSTFTLFSEANSQCMNKICLENKIETFMVASVVSLMKEQPHLRILKTHDCRQEVIDQLIGLGFDIDNNVLYTQQYPIVPNAVPQRENYKEEEEFQEDELSYSIRVELKAKIDNQIEEGKTMLCISVANREVYLSYVDNAKISTETNVINPLAKLEAQDVRNKEIVDEKIVEDIKQAISQQELMGDFTEVEESLLYMAMMHFVSRENFSKFGMVDKYYLTEEDKIEIVRDLDDAKKDLIKRETITAYLVSNSYPKSVVCDLLIDFAKLHIPNELIDITQKYTVVYEKRKERIEEKKRALIMPLKDEN